ncbi:hypothetical protein QR680_005329 [Steinernema hermaphroditum]|uniref:Uncharacterized protein n=1 Tax=Steinernema hermaphroditum TaxID=289476 RepID=A0AA39HT13_9BILA|nr:hypothetical protein QR680_005329 [Steinernema hermaphroditum]
MQLLSVLLLSMHLLAALGSPSVYYHQKTSVSHRNYYVQNNVQANRFITNYHYHPSNNYYTQSNSFFQPLSVSTPGFGFCLFCLGR